MADLELAERQAPIAPAAAVLERQLRIICHLIEKQSPSARENLRGHFTFPAE